MTIYVLPNLGLDHNKREINRLLAPEKKKEVQVVTDEPPTELTLFTYEAVYGLSPKKIKWVKLPSNLRGAPLFPGSPITVEYEETVKKAIETVLARENGPVLVIVNPQIASQLPERIKEEKVEKIISSPQPPFPRR
ncbi:MAG: hypothetical protein GXN92_03500 [Candidatus Micrarchaeota archaeon]|nr:hypothetical protein [Candidatus Micrarchaeota archaeon]